VRLEHRLDLRGACAAVDSVDRTPALHQDERGDVVDPETLREVRLLVHVDAHDTQARTFLARKVCQQALHPPSGAGPLRPEEDEERPGVVGYWASLLDGGPRGSDPCCLPRRGSAETPLTRQGAAYTQGVGDWYWIGVCAGLGVGIGVLLSALLGATRALLAAALVFAAGAGLLVGLGLGEWDEAIGGGVGGVLGALGAAQLVAGTLRRGGTRFGTALFMGVAALALAAIAWIPGVGYLEAAVVPALATRLRGRVPERYAGLRSLARD